MEDLTRDYVLVFPLPRVLFLEVFPSAQQILDSQLRRMQYAYLQIPPIKGLLAFPRSKIGQEGEGLRCRIAPLTNSEASDVGIMRCTKGLAQGRSNLSSEGARPWREAAPDSKARLSERQTAQSDGGGSCGFVVGTGQDLELSIVNSLASNY